MDVEGLPQAALVAALPAPSGCPPPVLQPWAGLNYGPGVGADLSPVYADALLPVGGGIADGVMAHVSVSLGQAPPFTVVFPDGLHVASRAVTTEVLHDHSNSLTAPSRIDARRTDYQGVAVIHRRHGDIRIEG